MPKLLEGADLELHDACHGLQVQATRHGADLGTVKARRATAMATMLAGHKVESMCLLKAALVRQAFRRWRV